MKRDNNPLANAVYQYIGFNLTRKANIYHCSQCKNESDIDLYLFGLHNNVGAYWIISSDLNGVDQYLSFCLIGYADVVPWWYILRLDDCQNWATFADDGITLTIDDDLTTDVCDEGDTAQVIEFNSLSVSQETRVCISSPDASVNGEYLWLYYDSEAKGSVYYNNGGSVLYPFINSARTASYYWEIRNESSNAIPNMRHDTLSREVKDYNKQKTESDHDADADVEKE
eukprot:760171_1